MLKNLTAGCPGAKKLKEARPDYMVCPSCKAEVEIWTDEPLARCRSCGVWVTHDIGVTCIDWCPKAPECIDLDLYERLKRARPEGLPANPSGGAGG